MTRHALGLIVAGMNPTRILTLALVAVALAGTRRFVRSVVATIRPRCRRARTPAS